MKDFRLNENIRLSPQESMQQAAEKVRKVFSDTVPASITRENADKLLEARLNGKDIAVSVVFPHMKCGAGDTM